MSESTTRGRRSAGLTSIARHGRLRRSRPWLAALKYLGAAMAVVLVSGVTVAGYAVWKLESTIKTVTMPGVRRQRVSPECRARVRE